ncbi:MAG: hypothetical protein ABI835_10540 [Chloroflexota bacterium]
MADDKANNLMRVVYSVVNENGFGNNIMALARAYVIAQTSGLSYQAPVWPSCMHVKPATPNGYGYYFPSSRAERIKFALYKNQIRLNARLPFQFPYSTLLFTREAYTQTEIEDVGEACDAFLKTRGLNDPARSLILRVSPGTWGGYAGIKRARTWITNLLLSHGDTRTRFEQIEDRLGKRLRVALHVRMGDFAARDHAAAPGERNVRLPLEWYARICRQIREQIDCELILVTDGELSEFTDFVDEFRPLHIIGEDYTDLLSILLLSHANLVVCSNSTYSRLACFLNDTPYIWPADTLAPDESGKYGYLWEGLGNPVPASDDSDPEAIRRCFALPVDFVCLPHGIIRYLESHGKAPIEIGADLFYKDPVSLLH